MVNIMEDMTKVINRWDFFAICLQEYDFVVHYSMTGTLEQNWVVERWNRVLMDSKSMMSESNFPELLWGEHYEL